MRWKVEATPGSSHRGRAILLLLGAAIGWSLGGFLIKSVDWHPMAISGARSGIAAVVIFAAYPRLRLAWSVPLVAGTLAYTGTVVLFVLANKLTTAANAILLQYTAPVWVALLGWWILGEKARLADWAAMAAVLGGMGLFFLDRLEASGVWGNLAAVASGVAFALLIVILRHQRAGVAMECVFLGNVLAFAAGVPFMMGAGPGGEGGWGALLLLGIVQLALPYILFTMAVRHVRALDAILVPVIEPILNPLWAFLFLGEVPGPYALLGGAVVLAAVTGRGILGSGR